jgi:hypothetical protein
VNATLGMSIGASGLGGMLGMAMASWMGTLG